MNKIVYILLDAFRADYIDEYNTPFLYKCSQNGTYYKEVLPNLSYCERTEIFTGLKPSESGMFTAIGFNPEQSPYKNYKYIFLVLDFFEKLIFSKNRKLNRIFRFILSKTLSRLNFQLSCYNIPLSILNYFSLTEDKYSFFSDKSFNGNESIFTISKKKGINIFYDSFTALNFKSNGTDADRLRLAVENSTDNFGLYFIYIAAPDFFGHKLGPNSYKLSNELKQLDQQLEVFKTDFLIKWPNSSFIFHGDHGMREVDSHFNIIESINQIAQKYNLRFNKDFIYFVDSTMFRIWFLNDSCLKVLSDDLVNSDLLNCYGQFVTKEFANKFNIPFGDRKYGDLLWVANKGVLLFPDFFHNDSPKKGMHGYTPGDKSEHGMCIEVGNAVPKKNIKKIELNKIFQILKNKC